MGNILIIKNADFSSNALKQITIDDDTQYYRISSSLVGYILSASSSIVAFGESYSGTITLDSNYTAGSITITMNGTDITSTAYNNGSISISSVTGPVTITALAASYESSVGLPNHNSLNSDTGNKSATTKIICSNYEDLKDVATSITVVTPTSYTENQYYKWKVLWWNESAYIGLAQEISDFDITTTFQVPTGATRYRICVASVKNNTTESTFPYSQLTTIGIRQNFV